ncbi:MAG: hypothetical protein IJ887_13285 [Prevotella sp.]|nr:hypothetical protein [Prevotella sp.]
MVVKNTQIIISNSTDLKCNIIGTESRDSNQHAYLSENADYVINGDIDLNNRLLEIPETSSLIFKRGGFYNGTIKGNHTSMTGNVRVERLEGSFSTAIRSSYSTMETDVDKLKVMLSLNVPTLILDEDYSLSFPNGNDKTIYCSHIQHIIGEDIIISATNSDAPFVLISASVLKELCGITFNGNNTPFSGFLTINNSGQDYIKIENVNVINIINSINTSNIKGFYINKYNEVGNDPTSCNCDISIKNVRLSGLWQKGNEHITDPEGSVTGIQVYMDAGAKVNVKIDQCRFSDIHCYYTVADAEHIMYEDATGLFVHSAFKEGYNGESNNHIEITNIQGHNFGKRLVKTDCSNVNIRNVFGTNEYLDFLCLVGLNNSYSRFKHASVKNLHYEGVVGFSSNNGSYTLATAMRYTMVENIISKVTGITARTPSDQETGTNYPTFYPASINADDVTIRDLHMIGAQTVYLPANENIRFENVTYDDTEGAINSYSNGIFMPMYGASSVIDGLKVRAHHKRRLIACNYKNKHFPSSDILINDADLEFAEPPATSTIKNVLVEGQDWGIEDDDCEKFIHILNLTMKNCICRHAENFSRFPLRKYLGRWTLENIKFVYETIPESDDFKSLGGCFYVYNDVAKTLALKDITVVCTNITGSNLIYKRAIYLEDRVPGMVGTQVHLSNIRSNCTNYEVFTVNVCWGEYIDSTVCRKQYDQFGAAQKGFMVKDYSAGIKYVWSGTAWVALTV